MGLWHVTSDSYSGTNLNYMHHYLHLEVTELRLGKQMQLNTFILVLYMILTPYSSPVKCRYCPINRGENLIECMITVFLLMDLLRFQT